MDTTNPKSAIVDAIKKSTNILVTVSHDPSVDALAAALGLSLMLNKLDKHATAVFSGTIPHAIEFLEPEKRFEDTVSSLRDFIVALDKEKADRLRYKVEGDVVRIYITPYKTTITQKDLEFSEGDFNVDLVIALGVEQQNQLDRAITAHGKILHDASVVTINNNAGKSQLGDTSWGDDKASSLCEMLMSLSEALQANILDEQISTALLTGIVAATDRFSNEHTTPRVMTMSAQLMAAGANQQLIAEKLEQGEEADTVVSPPKDGSTLLEEGESKALLPLAQDNKPENSPQDQDQPQATPAHKPEELAMPDETDTSAPPPVDSPGGEIHVHHDKMPPGENWNQPSDQDTAPSGQPRPGRADQPEDNQSSASEAADDWQNAGASQDKSDDGSFELPPVLPPPQTDGFQQQSGDSFPDMQNADSAQEPGGQVFDRPAMQPMPPVFSTPQEPGSDAAPMGPSRAEPELRQPDDQRESAGVFQSSSESNAAPENDVSSRGKDLDPLTMQPIKSAAPLPELPPMPAAQAIPSVPPVFNPLPNVSSAGDFDLNFEEAPLPGGPSSQAIDDLKAEVVAAADASPATSSIDDARSAVSNAFVDQPLSVGGQITPASSDQAAPLPPPPPMPDFSTLPPLPSDTPPAPHPAAPVESVEQAVSAPPAPAPAAANQFRIPGQ